MVLKRDLRISQEEIARLRLRCDARTYPYYNVISELFMPKELEKLAHEHQSTCNVCGHDMQAATDLAVK